jgi:hypothetical protein
MLMQVLSLTQEQINGLPPTERDAIQALVCTLAETFFLIFNARSITAEPVHERYYRVKTPCPECLGSSDITCKN